MRTLKYALLGMLNQQDMTGYELMKLFEGALSEFWSVKHSQIYPELKRLTEEGMVTFTVEISGTVLEKKLYSITELGRADFMHWLSQPHKMKNTPKEEFRLQLFYSSALDPDRQIFLLEDQLHQHQMRLEHLEQNREKFGGIPEKGTYAFSDYMVLLGAIMREQTTCDWLRTCLQMCRPTEAETDSELHLPVDEENMVK